MSTLRHEFPFSLLYNVSQQDAYTKVLTKSGDVSSQALTVPVAQMGIVGYYTCQNLNP
jgi:hypothetical protein